MFKLLRSLNSLKINHKLEKTLLLRHNNLLFYPIEQKTNFHTTILLAAKQFIDNENRHAHQILQKHKPKYQIFSKDQFILSGNNVPIELDRVYQPNRIWKNCSTSETLEQLKLTVKYCLENNLCISNFRFDEFVNHFTDKCFFFNDTELLDALKTMAHIPETNSLNTPNFVEIWNALDDTCVNRIHTWDINQLLLVCDHWYILNLGKVNRFNWEANKKIGRKIRKLPANQLVQTMFYCNLLRNPPVTEMIDFEINMTQTISQMSIDEISIMCMGFFKTQTSLKNFELIKNIYQRLSNELTTIDDITLVNILKTLRYSSRLIHEEIMLNLLDKIIPEIPRLSLVSCLHIILLGSDIIVCHQKSIELILRRFNENLTNLRLKDMERISFVIGLYNFKTVDGVENELCEKILIELKTRVPEIMKYPRCLPSCLHYLTFRGYSDIALTTSVLDEQFIKLTYGKNATLGREIFSLDSYAEINLNNKYQGNRLTPKRRRTMGKLLSHYIPTRDGKFKLSATDTILLDLKDAVDLVYGHCKIAHVLPHYDRPDIIIAIDKLTQKGIDISTNYPENYSGNLCRPEMLLKKNIPNVENIILVNLIVGGWNNYVRNQDKLIGLLEQKVEQSKLIGFVPLVVPWIKWTRLTPEERTIYINNQISIEIS